VDGLARVNRTFRDKEDGLLVGYAPLTENPYEALAEYSARDQNTRPLGHDLDDAIAKVVEGGQFAEKPNVPNLS
jgi:type I restriction enzyme R subunit